MFYFSLDCNDECRLIERNRRLAIGLQIRNPDLSAKLTPRYSDFMKQWAKKDPKFCQMVHDKLSELVQLAKQVRYLKYDLKKHIILIKIIFSPSKSLGAIHLTQ